MATDFVQEEPLTLALEHDEQRVLLHDVDWNGYQAILKIVGDGHVRVAYDEGELEIMSPSDFHEIVKKTLGRIGEAYAEEKAIDIEGLGSTTFKRRDLAKGLEPDECYYVAHVAHLVGRRKLDLRRDPPPDLAIEIDISPARVQRQPIYAALGVPEMWRFDGRELQCLHRSGTGKKATYVVAEKSLAFPELAVSELNQFIEIALDKNQSAAIRALRQWARPA
jgi:Uma2 family endonuclease